jgi:hypothetical protein
LYIFVLYIDPNGQCVLPVYFWSWHQPIRSFLLHQSYNIMFYNSTIYCNIKSATDEFSWYCLILIKFRMQKNIYCSSETILLFLSHNKLYINDRINCLSIMLVYFCSQHWAKRSVCLACIFFVSTKTYQIHFIVSEWQYNVVCRSNILLLQFYLYIFVLNYYPNRLRFAPVYFGAIITH